MADMVDIPPNVLIAGTGVLGAIAGVATYLWKGKQKELDEARAETKSVQLKYEDLLKSMIASEPQRKEALDSMARAIADNTALLRERIKA